MRSFDGVGGNSTWGTQIRGPFRSDQNGLLRINGNLMSGKILSFFGLKEQLQSHANVRREVMYILTRTLKIRG